MTLEQKLNGKKERKNMEKYSIINFKNLDWYVIDIDEINGTTRLLLKDVLNEERIKKYVDDEWYRNGSCVRYTYDVRPPFNWDNSYIKNVVLPNFIKDLGIECKATLLTKEEVESLPDDIRKCNDWWWTRTNASDETDKYAYAFYVDIDGFVNNYNVYNAVNGLRPAVSISSELFKNEDKKQDETDTLEKENETMVCSSKKNGGKNLFADLEELTYENTFKDNSTMEVQKIIVNKINELIRELKRGGNEKENNR